MSTRIDVWLAQAIADAEQRGLAELKPLLETLARSTAALRAAEEQCQAQHPLLASDRAQRES
jgi:hypothetical protein